jgi:hypothetical protein
LCFIFFLLLSLDRLLKALSSSSTTTTTTTQTLSPEEIQRQSIFREFLNLSLTNPHPNFSRSSLYMKTYMRSIYRRIDDTGDDISSADPSFYRFDSDDFLIGLPNRYRQRSKRFVYSFTYDSSLESLINIELILPVQRLSTVKIASSTFDITLTPSCSNDQQWCKINLTRLIRSFPLTFHLTLLNSTEQVASLSSAFLILHFRPLPSASLSFDEQLITYPDDSSHCQVRPFRISFTKLHWSSWIIEPHAYEMNICSGTCHTQSHMATYSIIQNLVHQKFPRAISAPCCQPKRFASVLFLYFDGMNLILKRHENMRVTECTCSL